LKIINIFFKSSFIILLFASCAKKELAPKATYFGGKIINPKSNMVLFIQSNNNTDTLLLNKNNMFLKKIDHLSEGLYVFKHGPEFQYIYLEPSDSIFVRINTWDFDESLVFNGKGSKKNEFLINLFLENEKIDKAFYPNYELSEKKFLQKLKAIVAQKEQLYAEFKMNQKKISKGFDYIVQADKKLYSSIKKEKYPRYFKTLKHKENLKLSDTYYDYRKQVDLNDKKLLNFFRYQNYIINYLYNTSYSDLKSSSKENLTLLILKKINKEITLPEFKNDLLYRIVIDDFYADNTYSISTKVLDFFYTFSTNKNNKQSIKKLVNDRCKITTGSTIVDFQVLQNNHKKTSIKPILKNKNTVLYFWSPKYVSVEALSKRIHFLEKKFFKLNFVGINFDKPTINPYSKKNLLKNQYQLPNDCMARSFLKSNFPRTVLINRKGKVVNSFTSLESNAIEKQLALLEKQ